MLYLYHTRGEIMRKRVNGITKNKGAVYKGAVVLSTIFIFGVSM